MASVDVPICRVRGRGRGVLALTSFDPLPRPSKVLHMKNDSSNGKVEQHLTPSKDIRSSVTVQRIGYPATGSEGVNLNFVNVRRVKIYFLLSLVGLSHDLYINLNFRDKSSVKICCTKNMLFINFDQIFCIIIPFKGHRGPLNHLECQLGFMI